LLLDNRREREVCSSATASKEVRKRNHLKTAEKPWKKQKNVKYLSPLSPNPFLQMTELHLQPDLVLSAPTLPYGWLTKRSRSNPNLFYYYNHDSGQSTFTSPLAGLVEGVTVGNEFGASDDMAMDNLIVGASDQPEQRQGSKRTAQHEGSSATDGGRLSPSSSSPSSSSSSSGDNNTRASSSSSSSAKRQKTEPPPSFLSFLFFVITIILAKESPCPPHPKETHWFPSSFLLALQENHVFSRIRQGRTRDVARNDPRSFKLQRRRD